MVLEEADIRFSYTKFKLCFIIIIIIIYSLVFFPSALADGLSLEFEWQQVSSSLQDLWLLISEYQKFR